MARPRTICLLLALITVLVYSPVRHVGWVVFDDPDYVGNAHVQAGLSWDGVKWAFTTWQASNWHPLTWLSHMLDASLFGPNPGAQHLVNVLFHAANAVLLFLFLYRATEKLWAAALVAALFAWHPMHVESVAWLSERKDVLSTFFGLLTLIAYLKYVHSPQSKTWYIWTLVFFILSLIGKPMLVTLPFLMLLLDFWPLGRTRWCRVSDADVTQHGSPRQSEAEAGTRNTSALLIEKLPFFALTLASCIVTFFAQRAEAVVSLEQRPFGMRVANAVVAYAEYLGKIFCPVNLAVLYPLPHQIPSWQVALAAIILIVISWAAWRMRKRWPYLLVGWLWFLGTLVPVIGLVQVGGQAMADRYSYVPSIGIFVMLVYGLNELVMRARVPIAMISTATAAVLLANIVLTEYQLGFWQNSLALFHHTIDVTGDNPIAHINLGVALEQEDEQQKALAEYRKAIELDPNRFQAHNNLANLLSSMSWRDAALGEYQEALRLNPNAALTHANYGTQLSEMGRFDEAMREYTKAARLAPEDARPPYLMGKACLRHGQSAEAVKHFRDALRLDPNDFQTLTWLARVLAADQNAAIRNGAQALAAAKQANELTGGEQPFVLDTLAMAEAESGHFQDAQETEQQAVKLATAAGAQKLLPELQKRLQAYQAGRPWREDFTKTGENPQ
jgi:tetratricopeptide (TPR) repeat protein